MIQMSAAANRATPTNSLTRRDTVDPLTVSDLHDDGHDQRPPPRAFAEEAAQLRPQLFLGQALSGAFLDAGLLRDVDQDARAVGEQRLAVFHHEPARDDLGHPLERARLLVYGDERLDQAVLGKMPCVAEDFIVHLARPGPID